MRFWDASAIVACCPAAGFRESHGVSAGGRRRLGVVGNSARMPLGVLPAGPRGRPGLCSASGGSRPARHAAECVVEILPREAVRERAARTLRIHGLKAADALQLASSLVWSDGRQNGRACVTGDHRLGDAADLEGFAVVWTS